jgi:hypothetical protein
MVPWLKEDLPEGPICLHVGWCAEGADPFACPTKLEGLKQSIQSSTGRNASIFLECGQKVSEKAPVLWVDCGGQVLLKGQAPLSEAEVAAWAGCANGATSPCDDEASPVSDVCKDLPEGVICLHVGRREGTGFFEVPLELEGLRKSIEDSTGRAVCVSLDCAQCVSAGAQVLRVTCGETTVLEGAGGSALTEAEVTSSTKAWKAPKVNAVSHP